MENEEKENGVVGTPITGPEKAMTGIAQSSESARGSSRPQGVPLEEDENAQKREQDKEVAQTAPAPLPKSSDSGKPTWRQNTPRRSQKEVKKDIGSFSRDFGLSLLKLMGEDKAFMDEVNGAVKEENFIQSLIDKKDVGDPLIRGLADYCVDLAEGAAKEQGVEHNATVVRETALLILKIAFIGAKELIEKEGSANA
jgi:hypothetical protein